MYKFSKDDIKIFKRLQLTPFEVGGKIILNNDGVLSTNIIPGKIREININQISTGLLWFHTHPCRPIVKDSESIFSKVLEQFKKKKDFTIDVLVQPFSDDDLLVVKSSILQKRTCMMAVFTPEGIYILSNSNLSSPSNISPKNSPSILKSSIHIESIKEPQHIRVSKYLKERDNYISDEHYELLDKLSLVKNYSKQISLLKNYQIKIAKNVIKIANKFYPELHIKFYSWNSKFIPIIPKNCNLPF